MAKQSAEHTEAALGYVLSPSRPRPAAGAVSRSLCTCVVDSLVIGGILMLLLKRLALWSGMCVGMLLLVVC